MQLKQTADREDIYMRIVVEKYHGLGNDYLVYDPNKNKLKLTPSNVQLMWVQTGSWRDLFWTVSRFPWWYGIRTAVWRKRAETVSGFLPNI